VNVKHVSISSYSDLSKLSSFVKIVHFRKFLNRNILQKVLDRCSNLEKISVSKYVFNRCDPDFIEKISKDGLNVERSVGRPNLIERLIYKNRFN